MDKTKKEYRVICQVDATIARLVEGRNVEVNGSAKKEATAHRGHG